MGSDSSDSLRTLFERIDANCDGQLTMAELTRALGQDAELMHMLMSCRQMEMRRRCSSVPAKVCAAY